MKQAYDDGVGVILSHASSYDITSNTVIVYIIVAIKIVTVTTTVK